MAKKQRKTKAQEKTTKRKKTKSEVKPVKMQAAKPVLACEGMTFDERIINVMNVCKTVQCTGISKDREYCYTKSPVVREMFNDAFCKYGLFYEDVSMESRDIIQQGEAGVEVVATFLIKGVDCPGSKRVIGIGRGFNGPWSINTAKTMALKQAFLDAFMVGWDEVPETDSCEDGHDFDMSRLGGIAGVQRRLDNVLTPDQEMEQLLDGSIKSGPMPAKKENQAVSIKLYTEKEEPTEGIEKPTPEQMKIIDTLITAWDKLACSQSQPAGDKYTIDRQACMNAIWEESGFIWPTTDEQVDFINMNTESIFKRVLRRI